MPRKVFRPGRPAREGKRPARKTSPRGNKPSSRAGAGRGDRPKQRDQRDRPKPRDRPKQRDHKHGGAAHGKESRGTGKPAAKRQAAGDRGEREATSRRPEAARRAAEPGRQRRTVHRKLPPAVAPPSTAAGDAPPPETPADMALLEQRIGHSFAESRLLRRALTHSSASADNYQRLEFLGDAALGLIVGRLLYEDMPDATEQHLTLMRAHVVSAPALVEVANGLELGRFLFLGTGERRAGNAVRPSILADALEGVLGAVLCDSDLEITTNCVRRLFAERLASAQGADLKDAKTRLQEHLQQRGLALPRYEIAAAGGLDHAPVYAVECVVEALGVYTKGVAGSRREAEKEAAAAALEKLEAPSHSSIERVEAV